MTDDTTGPTAPKLLAGFAVKFRIAAACAAVLGVGAWLAPAQRGTLTTPDERPAPLLEEQVQLREAAVGFNGLQDAVARLSHRGVEVRAQAAPADTVRSDFGDLPPSRTGFGVVIDASHVVTHEVVVNGAPAAVVTGAAGAPVEAIVAAVDSASGLALLRLPVRVPDPPALTDTRLELGAIAIAAAKTAGADLVIPTFVSSTAADHYRLSAGDAIAPGMPIYTVAGELAAIAGRDGIAWRTSAVLRMLFDQSQRRENPAASLGVSYQAVGPALEPAFGKGGVVVAATVSRGPAALAGIREGDVIVAINDQPISDPATLATTIEGLPVGSPVAILVRRGAVTRTLTVTPQLAREVTALARSEQAPDVDAASVFEADVLEAARVPANATIISIDGNRITTRAEAVREAARQRAPAPVLLEHGGIRFFAVLGAAR